MNNDNWTMFFNRKHGPFKSESIELFGCEFEQVQQEVSDSRTEQVNKENGYNENLIRAGVTYIKTRMKTHGQQRTN